MASTMGSRLAYDKAKEAINRAGFSASQAVLSQGYLRAEVTMTTTKTLYTFAILQNDQTNGAQTNTEQRLALQDAFYCSSIGIYVAKPSSATDTTFPLCTYPNAQIFSTANVASSLYSFYNSFMSLTVNNRQIIPTYDVMRHYDVPQTQQFANADYTTSGYAVRDQQRGIDSGTCPIEPGIVFVGSKQNVLQITMPVACAAVETFQRAVIIFRGHLAQNVTPVR